MRLLVSVSSCYLLPFAFGGFGTDFFVSVAFTFFVAAATRAAQPCGTPAIVYAAVNV